MKYQSPLNLLILVFEEETNKVSNGAGLWVFCGGGIRVFSNIELDVLNFKGGVYGIEYPLSLLSWTQEEEKVDPGEV